MNTTEQTVSTSEKSASMLDEDWAVVVLGFMIILLFLVGINIPAPAYKWSGFGDLRETVFTTHNILRIVYQFVLVFVFSILALWITNKPVRAAVKVFPVLYLISVTALLLEGNAAIRSLNLMFMLH